ncbi:tumor necrosis factor receptor superfamily member 6B-like isoform X2 [Sphaeramia orbicularis]|uniref:tumor necrosis factor receptor superfamily member 6B-like isoform X2 n=1 Tax=Sphaeramia orbicularis TaxID=375764 RepID=UPI00117C348E|nr:tumor necrosis factor receptor superfamily member 6B-like isoform X2 [Sphaeramia orbicularis]
MMALVPVLPLLLLLVHAARPLPDPLLTFRDTDPVSGKTLECDRCPPGTFLRARCTATRKTVCETCPPGSFTELWNYVPKCLRCGVCAHNQVEKSACTASSDCQCACKDGYFFKETYGMCRRHAECPSGHGVLTTGSALVDTICHVCPNGTFSDVVSSVRNCSAHRSCAAARLKQVMRGSAWHDSVCANCTELQTQDGADFLRQILPKYFVHHKLSLRRLRQFVRKLPSEDRKKTAGNVSGLDVSGLHSLLDAWIAAATVADIRRLPDVLTKIGANNIGDRLLNKLRKIESQLTHLTDTCSTDAPTTA